MADNSFIDSDGNSKLLIDPDTLTDRSGKRYRYSGFDGRETEKVVEEDGKFVYKPGEKGGNKQKEAIATVINEGNFTNIDYSGNYDTSEGERELITSTNPEGQDLMETLYAAGIAEINEFTPERGIIAKQEADLIAAIYGDDKIPFREIGNEYNDYVDRLGKEFKTLALNERYYDPDLHTGVQFRNPDRTIDNKAIGFIGSMGVSFDQGIEGLKEGLFGYADAIGETFGIESLERFGEAGVSRAKQRMMDAPEVVLDYKDIDSVSTGFQYVLNNTAMMVPQIMLAFGSMAVAAPFTPVIGAGGALAASTTPLAMTMAGQTWNEMEGEKGVTQFIAASMAGVGMSALERFGLERLVKPGQVLSKQGFEKVARSISQKQGIGIDQARNKLLNVTRQEVGKYTKELALRLNPKDIAKFSVGEIARRGLTGMGTEASTEVAQDIIQTAVAASVSETTYTQEELLDRAINAALAGGSVGGALSMANNIHQQGKNKLMALDRGLYSADRNNVIENKRIEDANNGVIIPDVENIIEEAEGLRDNGTEARRQAHDSYIVDQQGLMNTLRNIKDPKDFVDAAIQGAAKLVLASEKAAINMEKLVLSPMAMKIFALIGADTTGRYHSGANFKEAHDLTMGEMTALVDEPGIGKLLGFGKLKTKNVEAISRKLREFGRSGQFDLYEAYTLSRLGAYPLVNIYYDVRSTPQQRAAAKQALAGLGLTEPAQIKRYRDVAKANINNAGLIELNLTVDQEVEMKKLYIAAKQVKNSYDKAHEKISGSYTRETGDTIGYNPDYWWQHQGFDWKKVKANKEGFMKWLKTNLGSQLTEDDRQELYESIVRQGQGTVNTNASLINGVTYLPNSVKRAFFKITEKPNFSDWSSDNMFETLHRNRMDAAKYSSVTDYFGHGGRKLNKMFQQLVEEQSLPGSDLSKAEIDKFAYYMTSIIDSTHGNFNRIESKKAAAINSFLTSWSLLAGLPLAALSSIPETALLFFNLKTDAEFKAATKQLTNQVMQAFDKALAAEVAKTEKLLKEVGQSADTSSVVDRLATGERDVAFMRLHESFFKGIGLTKVTQIQRRMAAGLAVDFVKSGFDILDLAPRKKIRVPITIAGKASGFRIETGGFDFDKMSEIEIRTYNQLLDLGINPDEMMELLSDLDQVYRDEVFNVLDKTDSSVDKTDALYIKSPSKRVKALRKAIRNMQSNNAVPRDASVVEAAAKLEDKLNDIMDLAVYRFVKERVQLPGAANRPLFFQDPHYQLFTQFNGFISTFTANIVPKLWNKQLRKGTPQVKYDTFAMIVTMIALGAASQHLKDIIKFGQASPYLDEMGYAQRALYSSGVLGQYEKVLDAAKPLYPTRGDNSFSILFGESGPSARNIQRVFEATGDLLSGEGERGVAKLAGAAPYIAPFTGLRHSIGKGVTGQNPFPDIDIPTANEVRDILLK